MKDVDRFRLVHPFIARLRRTETAPGFGDLLADTTDRLGYAHFAYHVVRSPAIQHGTGLATIGLTNYPDMWSSHYIRNGYVNDDPVVAEALTASEPFLWSSVLGASPPSMRQAQIMDDARDVGICDGLTVPLTSRHGEHAVMTFVAGPDTPSPDPAAVGMLQLLSEFFHAHALHPILQEELTRDRKRRRSILSARERESMVWVARGKSSWEIARILGIAEKSVEFYVESVKRKLQAANRTHAVVKAVMLGLIEDPLHATAPPRSARPQESPTLVPTPRTSPTRPSAEA